MICETKISKGFQTVVPSDIRKKFNLKAGDVLEWAIVEDKIEILHRKRVTIADVFGTWDGPAENAVEVKKRIARGEKF